MTMKHVLALSCLLVIGSIGTLPSPLRATPPAPAVASVVELSKVFRSVHATMKESVVNIRTSRTIAAAPAHGKLSPRNQIPEELRRMLPVDPFGEAEPDATPGGKAEGTGSGVLISADGYILTNNHVIDDATDIVVRLSDNRELTAKVIGRDPKTDLAVIKIEGKDFSPAKLGDSDKMDVGDWVLAFGSPFGFEQTMTQGIISAKGRQVNIIASNNPALAGLTYENFIQTDAAINPGNSGGPLVNLQGEVVGMNTAIASRSGAYNGIGFSIPSNDARFIMDSLIKNGKVIRGYLGINIADIRDNQIRKIAESFGYTGGHGILVQGLAETSPGAKAGLQRGDIIVSLNGKTLESVNQFRGSIARTAPKDTVTLGLFRNGKTLELKVAVGTQPDSSLATNTTPATETKDASVSAGTIGITVTEVTPALARRLGINSTAGVVITKVDPDGLAAELGLTAGDVILNIHGKDIQSLEDFNTALGKRTLAEGVRLSIRSANGTERFVFVQKK